MLNFDFFQPIKHRNEYSVGVLYLANLNLQRSVRFKWENTIVVGIIPGLDKEPGRPQRVFSSTCERDESPLEWGLFEVKFMQITLMFQSCNSMHFL